MKMNIFVKGQKLNYTYSETKGNPSVGKKNKKKNIKNQRSTFLCAFMLAS